MDRGEPRTGRNFEVWIPLVVIASPAVSFYMIGQAFSYTSFDPTSSFAPDNPDTFVRGYWMWAALLLGMQLALIVRGVVKKLVWRTAIPVVGLLIASFLVLVTYPRVESDDYPAQAPTTQDDRPVCYSGSYDCPGG